MALDADDGVSNTETLLPLSGSEWLIAEEEIILSKIKNVKYNKVRKIKKKE